MQSIVLYFNELCLKSTPIELDQEFHWRAGVAGLAEAIDSVLALRPDGNIAFPLESWIDDCGGCPLCVRFRQQLPKDRYRRLLLRVKKISDLDRPDKREVHFSGHAAFGLTLADMAADEWMHGWAVSLALSHSPWLQSTIAGQRLVLNDQGDFDDPIKCVVGHLSSANHVKHWQAEIRDWGANIAASCELTVIDGHPVVMYPGPLEHGPAHVHLLESPGSRRTLAQFEIDQFRRYKGLPTWDTQMKEWITKHREPLLRSWDRCQRGGLPYTLDNDP